MTPSHAKVEDTVHMTVQGFQLGPSTVSSITLPVAALRAEFLREELLRVCASADGRVP